MSSIVTAVFKATIGLLVNKVRDKAAERLKEGDVTDEKVRIVIVRELHDIKSKLDGLSRQDLLASISFFEEGIELLYEVFKKARCRSDDSEVPVQAACAEAFALAEELRNVDLTGLDESAERTLTSAKKRFEKAREDATRAFKNESLKTSDRILAMEYRIMATILETIDYPTDAIAPCRVCIKELNCLSAVQNSFDVQLRKGIMAVKALFSKHERRKIISRVCLLNRVILDVTQAVGKEEPFWMRPAIDTKEEKFDPLRDGRMLEVLRKQNMEHCFVAHWSFGQEGEEEHKLSFPCGMAINSKGQFIIADTWDEKVKVFDSRGKFIDIFSLPGDVDHAAPQLRDIASDMNDNNYVLAKLPKPVRERSDYFVYKFNDTGKLLHKFAVSRSDVPRRLTVNSKDKVMCLYSDHVDIHENAGQFVSRFGNFENAWDLTCGSDGRVMVLDSSNSVHVFSERGEHLSKIKHKGCTSSAKIAFHNLSGHIIIAYTEHLGCVNVGIYTKDGEFVRSTEIHTGIKSYLLRGLAVSGDGYIAVVSQQRGQAESKANVFIVC